MTFIHSLMYLKIGQIISYLIFLENMMLLVGNPAPNFKGVSVIGGDSANLHAGNAFKEIKLEDYKGKWVVFFFYPLDFTFVCPTEIEDFGKHYEEFKKLNAEVIACSTDSQFSHLAWREAHKGLKNLPYPMLADFTKETARSFGVLKEETGYALRGLYIIDPEGTIKYSVIHPEAVGRSSKETLRVLQALQSGKMTPCGWEPGEATL